MVLSVFIYNISCPLNIFYFSLYIYSFIKYPFIENLYGRHYYKHWRMEPIIHYTLLGERNYKEVTQVYQEVISPMKKNKLK